MANSDDNLEEYPLLQSDQQENVKIDINMPTIEVPVMQDTQDSFCLKWVN